jgi:hypothetical protein
MSMTPDKELVSLDYGKLDPLKSKIMSQVDGFSDFTAEHVLKIINTCTDESKSTNWVQCVKDLKKYEKSQGLSKLTPLSMAALSAVNLAWLGYSFVNKLLGAEQLCFIEEMDGVVFPLGIVNYFTLCASLALLGRATSCCHPSYYLSKDLRTHLKEQKLSGNNVMLEGLTKSSFAKEKNKSLHGQFLEAAKFTELPDGSVDVAQFKKVFRRSHGLDSEELRYLLMFSFLFNAIPSMFCGPGYQQGVDTQLGKGLGLAGLAVSILNAMFAFANFTGYYRGARKQVSTDIRSVINLIKDHLDEQRASDDMV